MMCLACHDCDHGPWLVHQTAGVPLCEVCAGVLDAAIAFDHAMRRRQMSSDRCAEVGRRIAELTILARAKEPVPS